MQFDLRTVDPPELDLAWVLWIALLIASIIGLFWTASTILRRRLTDADLVVWFAGLAGGLVTRLVAPRALPHAQQEGYYILLFLLWLGLSVIAAGAFLLRRGASETGPVGRWMVQGMSVFIFGAFFLPALLAALVYAARR